MSALGIDIGVNGAIALVSEQGELLSVKDMPTLNDGVKGRRTINAPLLYELILSMHANKAFVEKTSAMPQDGVVGAEAFGRSRGVIEMGLAAASIPMRWITPPQWKRAVVIQPQSGKDASRSEAIRRWPDHAKLFELKKNDGRAEAALIAVAGLRLFP